ncbi:MAG: dUTP diphosphatase [Wolinella sp.]
MKVQILKLHERAVVPRYHSDEAAGFDLHSIISTEIESFGRALIPTGIAVSLTRGYELQIRPRSGLALKHGITVLNTPGTVDSDYRGELKVLLINLSNEPFKIEEGDRIAQAVISQVFQAEFIEVEALDETVRGAGGFGSTGQ